MARGKTTVSGPVSATGTFSSGKNGTIYLLDKQRIPVMWWDFKEAFPFKWTGPDLRADSGSVAVESVELAHRGLSRPTLGNLLAGIGGALSGSLDVSFGL